MKPGTKSAGRMMITLTAANQWPITYQLGGAWWSKCHGFFLSRGEAAVPAINSEVTRRELSILTVDNEDGLPKPDSKE